MKTTIQQRLASYRKTAAGYAAKHPTHTAGASWRYWVRHLTDSRNSCGTDGVLYIERDKLDLISDDKTNRGRDACGWYADCFGHSAIYGAVARINLGARGVLFAPVTYQDDFDGATVYLQDAKPVKAGREFDYYGYTDDGQGSDEIRTALRYARHYAEREAERSRDDDAQDLAMQLIEDHKDNIRNTRRQCLQLIRDIKAAQRAGIASTGAICTALRNQVREMLEDIRADRRRILKLEANYWEAVAC